MQFLHKLCSLVGETTNILPLLERLKIFFTFGSESLSQGDL